MEGDALVTMRLGVPVLLKARGPRREGVLWVPHAFVGAEVNPEKRGVY